MHSMKLSEIATALSLDLPCSDRTINAICTDTRGMEPGCLFIAIKGDNFDGHDFVGTAFANGAAAAVCRKGAEAAGEIFYVNDTRQAFLDIARCYRMKFDIPLVGLTGSVGKTTTKDMIACVLCGKYNTLKTEENNNNDIGLSKTILKMETGTEAAVLEMGMRGFGEISVLARAALPTMGVITNIGVSHIERLGSQQGILKAKLEIMEGMDGSSPLFLNADDELLYDAAQKIGHPVVFYGIDNINADYIAKDIVTKDGDTEFDIYFGKQRVRVKLPAIGKHNVLNALCAFAVGMSAGIEQEAAALALESYVPSGMRQKIVRTGGILVVEDCYNASPDSVKASLEAFKLIDGKRKIVVLGDMLELGDYSESAHMSCGEAAAKTKPDALFLYGRYTYSYRKGAETRAQGNIFDFSEKSRLTAALIDYIRDGDALLFKASRGVKLEEVINALYRSVTSETDGFSGEIEQ